MSVPFSLRLCLILFPKSNFLSVQFSSVQSLSHVRLFAIPWTASSPGFPIHHQLLELAQTLVHWVSDAVQPSHPPSPPSPPAVNHFQHQSFFQWVIASGGQSIGASASASVLSMNIQVWFPLGLTDLISLLSKGLSTVFSNTIVQKHQFFGIQLSLWSNSNIHTRLLEKP